MHIHRGIILGSSLETTPLFLYMKQLKQHILEKLRINDEVHARSTEIAWYEFVQLFKKFGMELYLDELGLELDVYNLPNGQSVSPTSLFYDRATPNSIILSYYDSINDDDDILELEDFEDIKRLFVDDNAIEKIIDYIS